MFHSIMGHLQTELQPWLSRLIQFISQRQHSSTACDDLFMEVTQRLTTFINSDTIIGESFSKQPFHSQHILMNVNEVVSDFPFGIPTSPVVGPGGAFGAQILHQDMVFNQSDRAMVRTVMSDLLEQYKHESPQDLTMLGLKREPDESVVVSINSRPITVCLAEHGCCEQFTISERGPGGTKGLSKRPKLYFTYCLPIPYCDFMTPEANQALSTFREMVDRMEWLGNGDSEEEVLNQSTAENESAGDSKDEEEALNQSNKPEKDSGSENADPDLGSEKPSFRQPASKRQKQSTSLGSCT
jgi:hypothetical protein